MIFYKFLDFSVIVLVLMFFVGMFAFEYDVLGFASSPLPISYEWKPFFELLIWPLVVLLVFDLVLKYRKVKDPKIFLKKHWIDIIMMVLIPVFSAFKFFKIGLSLIKHLKTAKMGAKALHKTKKIAKK